MGVGFALGKSVEAVGLFQALGSVEAVTVTLSSSVASLSFAEALEALLLRAAFGVVFQVGAASFLSTRETVG